ncbi:MAG: hypothetical protein RIR17_705, partial [Planctomycetota bacterium]
MSELDALKLRALGELSSCSDENLLRSWNT